MKKLFLLPGLFLALAASLAAAPYDEMDYGPFLSATYVLPGGNVALRGIALAFDAPLPGDPSSAPKSSTNEKGRVVEGPVDPGKCGVIFDTETLRYAGFWNGGFITWTGVAFNGSHGANPGPAGPVQIATKSGPGVARNGKFDDPRAIPHGPLPHDHARYKGLYRSDDGIVFSYTAGFASVLDKPNVEVHGNLRCFTRTLNVTGAKGDLALAIADMEGAQGTFNEQTATLEKADRVTLAAVTAGAGATLTTSDSGRIVLKVSPSAGETRAKVALWSGPKTEADQALAALTQAVAKPADLSTLTKGGKARFTATVATKGVRGDDSKGPYVIDSITPPFQNPYKSWIRIGGFDVFPDGRIACSTWSGDVWIASGIDDQLEKITWKRYASGLFHALGLKIVDGQIYVLGRDQITRLHDFNKDGEADFYECFNNDGLITSNFHEFIFDLHTDPEGNFYYVRGGPVRPGGRGWDKIVPHHGTVMKVSRDGSKLEVVARGFRAPNGMGLGPKGEITTGDNEGTWTPTCPINWIKPGGFYGVPEFAEKDPKTAVRDNPLCWLPHKEVDNSNGGQVWITGDKFGPLSGKLLHMSYGKCSLYEVMHEEVGGQMQGGVVPLLKFDSGVCRARFIPGQNALYLSALRGWQTSAAKDAGLYRVRYTGAKANLPVDLKVRPGEVQITFSDPLDKAYAADVDNYQVEQWNYRWTQSYGSPQVKVSDPKANGRDEVEIDEVQVSPDGKVLTLRIQDLRPVMQMKITYNLKDASGAPVRSSIYNTINVVGNLRGEVHPGEYRVVETKK